MPVSIVMPTYNGMKYLEQAIASVLAQSYQDWELLISDDGSKDETRQFLTELRESRQDPRIRVFFQDANLGIFGNLNFLFREAQYSITQILCQDDYLIDEHALDRLMAEWSAQPAEIAFLRANHGQDTVSKHALFEGECLPAHVDPAHSDLYFFAFGCIPGNLSNVSVRTQAVAEAGWFRPDLPYAGDFEFWSRLGRSRPWTISRVSTCVIRRHAQQASATLNPRGELMTQMRFILETLYANLRRQGRSKLRLKLMASAHYIARHRDAGLYAVRHGAGFTYLRKVCAEFDGASFSPGALSNWLVYVATLGARKGTIPIARWMLNEKLNSRP